MMNSELWLHLIRERLHLYLIRGMQLLKFLDLILWHSLDGHYNNYINTFREE